MFFSARTATRILLIVFGIGVLFFSSRVFSAINDTGVDTENGENLATNPKTRTTAVSATVVDIYPPTAPILVAPDNNGKIRTQLVTFTWKSSVDEEGGTAKYQLYLDGSLLYDSITTPTKNAPDYTYTDRNTVSNLVMKNALAEGSHTWKIRGFDTNGNYADSATWSFTIDTIAPVLLVKQIGDQTVSISAQDVTTIPTSPVITTTNPPTVSGTTEASVTVKLTMTLPNGQVTQLTTTSGTDGTFSFTLPTLSLNIIAKLQISANDSVGNTSLLDNIPVQVIRKTLKLPAPLDKVIPEIPIIPPEEIKHEIAERFIRPYVPEPVVDIVDTVAPIGNSAIGFVLPLARLLAVLWITGTSLWSMSVGLLAKAAHTIGLIPLWLFPPVDHIHGLVFDSQTKDPIPFALLTIVQMKDRGPTVVDQVVADQHGEYETIALDLAGRYEIVPTHRDYLFMEEEAKRKFSGIAEVYTGQPITTELCDVTPSIGDDERGLECHEDKLLVHYYVPMEQRKKSSFIARVIEKTAELPSSGLAGAVVLMIGIAFFYPTPWNIGMCVAYIAVAVHRSF
ncbi:MAG: hypothetical protein HZA34_00820 [Candidatus Pacebacteria bacterium]|nr:hypothetical protein [Candidatus Paceibacterota bacterium]